MVGDPILRKVVACTGTANLFSSMAGAVEIVFLIRVLQVRPADTGLLFALAVVGGVAGGVVSGRMARWLGSARVIWFSMLVFGLPQFLPALAEPGWRVALVPIGFATAVGVRPTLWIGLIGSWAAGFWVYFSPLRGMRDVPRAQEPEPTAALA